MARYGAKVAVAGLTGGIHVYVAATGGLLFRIADNASPISALAFSPSGNNLIAACADGALRAYDAANGQFLFPLLGHRGAVLSVAFAPDGNRVASGSTDGTARISFATIEGFFASGWRYLTKVDAATKELTAPLPELSALVRDCASLSRQLESHP